ncbi:fatty acid desaturase [Nostoc sp.]|uniref:fatty acid desaturase n=1 Tax=Nostoc sp. TaxID=1180 RepID=UPI002FF0AC1B
MSTNILTLWSVRFFMWNMPFHAEHHLYASIPFHVLPKGTSAISKHFTHIEPGYVKVNWDILTNS